MLRLARRGVASASLERVERVAGPDEIGALRTLVDDTAVSDEVAGYIASVVRKTRELPSVELGGSPRAAVHLMAASKARARLDGRDFVTPDDVTRMALPVLRHRLVLRPEAELERYTSDDAVRAALGAVEVPR
jgi:MoxR-like ATPase